MIDVAVLPIFFISIFFLAISPGPDLLLISSYSSTNGFKAGSAVSIGILLAGVIQTMLVGLGLGQLMQAMPTVAVAIKTHWCDLSSLDWDESHTQLVEKPSRPT